jgi:hypothetical protein
MMADGAAAAIGAFDKRIALAQGQQLQTAWAQRFAGDTIPGAGPVAAAAAGNFGEDAIGRG